MEEWWSGGSGRLENHWNCRQRTYWTTGPLVTGSPFIRQGCNLQPMCAIRKRGYYPAKKIRKQQKISGHRRLLLSHGSSATTALQQRLDPRFSTLDPDSPLSCRRRKYSTIKREFTPGHRSSFHHSNGRASDEQRTTLELDSLLPTKKILGNQKRRHSWPPEFLSAPFHSLSIVFLFIPPPSTFWDLANFRLRLLFC